MLQVTTIDKFSDVSFGELMSIINGIFTKESKKQYLQPARFLTLAGVLRRLERTGTTAPAGYKCNENINDTLFRIKWRYKINGVYQTRNHYFSSKKWMVTFCATRAAEKTFPQSGYYEIVYLNFHESEYCIFDVKLYGDKEQFLRDMLLLKLAI